MVLGFWVLGFRVSGFRVKGLEFGVLGCRYVRLLPVTVPLLLPRLWFLLLGSRSGKLLPKALAQNLKPILYSLWPPHPLAATGAEPLAFESARTYKMCKVSGSSLRVKACVKDLSCIGVRHGEQDAVEAAVA